MHLNHTASHLLLVTLIMYGLKLNAYCIEQAEGYLHVWFVDPEKPTMS